MNNTDKLEQLVFEQARTIEFLARRVSEIEAYLRRQHKEAEAVLAMYEDSKAKRSLGSGD